MSTSPIELAKRYWLDDTPGAATPGTRMNGILESLAKAHPLTEGSRRFLAERGLAALIRFADGEISEGQFEQLARAEQAKRVALAVEQQEARQLAAAASEAAMWARLEAERVKRESDPKFVARKRNQDLRRKFGVDCFVDELDFKRLMTILRRLDSGSRLSEEEAVWLTSEGREYASAEVRHAHNRLEANFCLAEFRRTGNIWNAVSASGHLRKCDSSREAHEMLIAISDKRLTQPKLKSAVRTTHGGVMRDLGRYDEAMQFGEEAHTLLPDSARPCTLLGALNIEQGNIPAGHEWYRKAEERGATTDSIASELRSILARMSAEKRQEITSQLVRIDPGRYSWLQKKAFKKEQPRV